MARTAVNCVESLSGNVNSSLSKSWSLGVGLDHNKVAELFYLGIYRNKSLYHIKKHLTMKAVTLVKTTSDSVD